MSHFTRPCRGWFLVALVLVPALLSLFGERAVPTASTANDDFGPGELIVGLRDNHKPPELAATLAMVGATILGETPELGALLVAVPIGTEPTALDTLTRSNLFRYVERNAVQKPPPLPAGGASSPTADGLEALFSPNDPYFPSQWGLAKIGAPQAWDISRGSTAILVAVIDSGYDVGHPDQPASLSTGPDYVLGGTVSSDGAGHGTHVTGIVAARINNSVGVAGLAPNVSVVAIRVLDSTGKGFSYNIAAAIRWAADAGAKIINLSLGGTSYSSAQRDAVAYAISRGALVVAAAGNCAAVNANCPTANPVEYPAAYPGVLAVGATDSYDEITSFSGHRDYVSVAAPGSAVLSTVPRNTGSSSYGYHYRTMSGTSMATPHVSALAALVWSANPSLTASQVRQIIESAAVDRGAPGKDEYYGYGRIDALAALQAAVSAPGPATPTRTPTPTPTRTPTPLPPTPTATPQPAQTIVPPGGGKLTSSNGRVQVFVPAGAVTQNVTLRHRAMPTPAWSGGKRAILSFELTASTMGGQAVTQFGQSLTLTAQYNQDDVPGSDEPGLRIYNRTSGETLPTTVDTSQRIATARTARLSTFDLVVDPHRAYLPFTTRMIPPTPTPTPPTIGDDFINPASGWPISDDDVAARGYFAGEYRILIKQAGYLVRAGRNLLAADFQAEVDGRTASHTTGAYGLYCGANNAGYYVYQLFDGGRFRLRRYSFSSASFTTLLGPTSSAAILPLNQTNRLKVVRNGPTIRLYANGQQIGQTADSTFGTGTVGLAASGYAGNFDARFDNFRLVLSGAAQGLGAGVQATRSGEFQVADPDALDGDAPPTPQWRLTH